MQTLFSDISLILTLISLTCILISIITEFTKEFGFLSKIPTNLQVLVTSLIVCFLGFFSYISYAKITFQWYFLVAVFFMSFVVAIICAKGWDYFTDIIEKFYKDKL